jgi:hypothetical protein
MNRDPASDRGRCCIEPRIRGQCTWIDIRVNANQDLVLAAGDPLPTIHTILVLEGMIETAENDSGIEELSKDSGFKKLVRTFRQKAGRK